MRNQLYETYRQRIAVIIKESKLRRFFFCIFELSDSKLHYKKKKIFFLLFLFTNCFFVFEAMLFCVLCQDFNAFVTLLVEKHSENFGSEEKKAIRRKRKTY